MGAPLSTPFRIAYGMAGLVVAFGIVLLLWLLLPISPLVLPPPAAVWTQLQDQNVLWTAFQFLMQLVPAFLKAIAYGVTAGVAISLSQAVAAIVYPILRVWRQLPFIALIPLFFIWFGLRVSQSDALAIAAMSLVIAVRTIETFSSAISREPRPLVAIDSMNMSILFAEIFRTEFWLIRINSNGPQAFEGFTNNFLR